MMKWVLVLLAAISGTALGGSIAYFRDRETGDDFADVLELTADASLTPRIEVNGATEELPELEVIGGREFEFGVMDIDQTESHTFEVRNIGAAPLTLEVVRTTCKCVVGESPRGAIAPGDVGEVSLEWTPRGYQDEFRQSAVIKTNDPQNETLILSARGRVIQSVRMVPGVLALGDATLDASREGTVMMLAYKDAELEIESANWIGTDVSEYLAVDWEPTEPTYNAVAAYDVKVRVLPGMPYGRFSAKLLFKLSSAPNRIECPVTGRVVADISVVGRGFSERRGVMNMGGIRPSESKRASLLLLVKGEHRANVEMAVEGTDPDGVLKAELGEPTSYASVVKYPLEIWIAEGAERVDHRGSEDAYGHVILRTTHPEIETIDIPVSFAVVE